MLLKNIKQLLQVREPGTGVAAGQAMDHLPRIDDAFLAIEDGFIAGYGPMSDWEGISDWRDLEVIDCTGKLVLPAWCDSHTHLVYAGSREAEFTDRIRGLSYEEIAARGGGILNSATRLQKAGEEELVHSAFSRLQEIMRNGTGAVEIKSGYGLTFESELKMLRVIRRLKELSPLTIKATFLGAHAIPPAFRESRETYIQQLVEDMIPAIASEGLADFCDVFCERNYFTREETIQILEAGKKYGLQPKVHANQLSFSGGVEAGVAVDAISVDHLEFVGDEQISLLKSSKTMPTLLPGAQFFLGLPHPPARAMIDAGLPLAIATDYNPGSCPSGNMPQMLSFACIQYRMTPEEAINAATVNSAYAMGMLDQLGSITIGKKANVMITGEVPSLAYLPYAFGSNLAETVIVNGKVEHSVYQTS